MPLSTLKEKGQITLPSTVRKQIHATKGDIFDVEVVDDKIIMTPQKLVPVTKKSIPAGKQRDLSRWIGSAPGVFNSVKEVDEFIHQQRDTWD